MKKALLKSSHPSSLRRLFDQFIETLESRLFLLCADHPPIHHFTVRRRLRLEKLPRSFVSFELSQIRFDQFRTSLFVGIDAGSILFACFIRFQAGGLHSFFFDQSLDVADVHCAPNAAGLARRETNLVTIFVDVLADAVDPPKAESFVNGFRPVDARLARVLLVEPDPEFFGLSVIGGEPFAEAGWGFEEFGIHSDIKRRSSISLPDCEAR